MSVVNLNLMRQRLHTWYAYSTNDALSNNTKVNDLVSSTFLLEIVFKFSCLQGKISQIHLLFYYDITNKCQ